MTNALIDQMYALRFLSNHAGLQDASTWIRLWCQDRKITNGNLAKENYHRVTPREQAQYSTKQQMIEVAEMAKEFGFTEAADFIISLNSDK